MTNEQYDIFMEDLPYVSPYSGLIPEGYGTDLEGATAVIFEDDDKLVHRILDVAAELDSLGIMKDQMKIAREIAMYHSASQYCENHGYTMHALFPGVQQDFDNLGLHLDEYEATFEAIRESKFEDRFRTPEPEDTIYISDLISTIPKAAVIEYQPELSEADEAVDEIRENLKLDLAEFESLREI